MRKILLLVVSITVVLICFNSALASSTGKVTAKIVDEDGIPVQGAEAKITFKFAKQGGIGLNTKAIKGNTDKEGFFTAKGKGMASISISAIKDEYYKSGRGYEFTSRSLLIGRWEPWNPTVEVVLKKKRNPVAMYDNHRTTYKVSKFDTPIGFDLEKEDWVVPYGKGIVSDFVITFASEIRAYTDYDCNFTLSFSNERDGLQEYYFSKDDQSYYKWPFEAPVDGYKEKLFKEKSIGLPEKGYLSNEKDNVNYLFRVRSEVDKDGNIVEAKYGKIVGEFGFAPKGKITFRYIFNPDGTRNLEEDPDRNLFKKK